MDFQTLKQKTLKGLKHPEMIEALKLGGYAEPIDEAWTKTQMEEKLKALPGRPDFNAEGVMVWVAEPTAEELAALEAEEAAKKAEEDRVAAEEKAKAELGDKEGPQNAPSVKSKAAVESQSGHLMLLNVLRNGISYDKGKVYELSTVDEAALRKINAIK